MKKSINWTNPKIKTLDYARAAAPDNTRKAYVQDWVHFARWCQMQGADPCLLHRNLWACISPIWPQPKASGWVAALGNRQP